MATRERSLIAQPILQAGLRGVASPFQFITTGEDNLVVSSWTNVPVADPLPEITLTMRHVDSAGAIQVSTHTHTPRRDRLRQQTFVALGIGAVLNLALGLGDTGTVTGSVYATVELVRGFPPGAVTPLGQLLGDYLSRGKALAWPGSPIVGPLEGHGVQRRYTNAAGGVGFEIGFDVPDGAAWRPRAFTGTFVASAVAGTRFPTLHIAPTGAPADYDVKLPYLLTVAASQSAELSWAPGYGSVMTTIAPLAYGPMPTDLLLTFGRGVVTQTVGLQAGDQWVTNTLCVEELLTALV